MKIKTEACMKLVLTVVLGIFASFAFTILVEMLTMAGLLTVTALHIPPGIASGHSSSWHSRRISRQE